MLLCFVMNGHIEGLLLEAHVKRRENPQMFSSSTKFWRWSRFRMTCAYVIIATFLFLRTKTVQQIQLFENEINNFLLYY